MLSVVIPVALCMMTSYGYIAQFEVEIERFRTLNQMLIADGSCCDYPRVGGKWNPCDFVFYIEQCSRDEFFVEYQCLPILQRFYAPANTEHVVYNGSLPRPYAQATLMLNVTVFDEDDGYSGDDYVGSYQVFLTRPMLNNGGREFANFIDHYITIPEHSELLIRYRGYCLDFECRNSNTAPAFLRLAENEGSNQFVRRSMKFSPRP